MNAFYLIFSLVGIIALGVATYPSAGATVYQKAIAWILWLILMGVVRIAVAVGCAP